jgi:hypothetical protein
MDRVQLQVVVQLLEHQRGAVQRKRQIARYGISENSKGATVVGGKIDVTSRRNAMWGWALPVV